MIKIVINTSENADWIKLLNGGKARKRELEIYDKLAKKAGKAVKRGEPNDATDNVTLFDE